METSRRRNIVKGSMKEQLSGTEDRQEIGAPEQEKGQGGEGAG